MSRRGLLRTLRTSVSSRGSETLQRQSAAATRRTDAGACQTVYMTWAVAIGGIAVLIVLHEFGHFLAAKAVGMRVERFSLFFPPKLLGVRRGRPNT